MSSSGDLNKRVTIQYQTKTPDGMGGFTTTWTDHATIWAAIWPVSAREAIQANAATMVITHRIRVRYRSVFKASWRLKYGDRYFAIVSIIDPNMSHEWLDIMAKEATT